VAKKKKGYGWMILLSVLVTLGGLVTLLPNASANKANLLGYKSLCSIAPISTLLCLIVVAVICIVRKKNFS